VQHTFDLPPKSRATEAWLIVLLMLVITLLLSLAI
jgi:hypothetical protein